MKAFCLWALPDIPLGFTANEKRADPIIVVGRVREQERRPWQRAEISPLAGGSPHRRWNVDFPIPLARLPPDLSQVDLHDGMPVCPHRGVESRRATLSITADETAQPPAEPLANEISTRRFFARPSGVVFGDTGSASP